MDHAVEGSKRELIRRKEIMRQIIEQRYRLGYTEYNLETLTHALELIIEARMQLKYSYIIDYFMQDGKNRDVLMKQQSQIMEFCELLDSITSLDQTHEELYKSFNVNKQNITPTPDYFKESYKEAQRLSVILEGYFNRQLNAINEEVQRIE